MPSNGDMNTVSGVYKTVCCDEEIVISEGVEFPDCPNHARLPTVWKLIGFEKERYKSKETAA